MRGATSHYTPRYVWDRVRLGAERRLRPFTPMLAGEITRHLARHIGSGHRGLEAGSGVSTIWFAERCAHLVSIEHDPSWAARVRNWLAKRGLSAHVDLRLCEPTPSGTARAYVGIIEAQPDASLDFVLIDGKKRDACVLAAVSKLKPGGVLVLDDVHRYIPSSEPSRTPHARAAADGYASPRWAQFAELTRAWPCIRATNGVYETAMWTKPA